jgi:hypothetical protein
MKEALMERNVELDLASGLIEDYLK